MDCITFLVGLALFDLFNSIGSRSFPGKRPIYPQYGDEAPSSDDPKDLPKDFLPVMMRFDGKKFVTFDDSQRLSVNLPVQGEESVHNFEEELDPFKTRKLLLLLY